MPRPITTGTKNKWNREHPDEIRLARQRHNNKVLAAARYCGMSRREFLALSLADRRMVFATMARITP